VVAEASCAYVLADAFLEKFGSDCLRDIQKAYKDYRRRIR
jgi:chorismate synthase